MTERPASVEALLGRMDTLLAPLEARKDPVRHFLATYRRTTRTAELDRLAEARITDLQVPGQVLISSR